MYNENDRSQYEYHQSYRPDYHEPISNGEPYENSYSEPPKKKGNGKAVKITALVLGVLLLAGCSFGGGWLMREYRNEIRRGESQVLVSDRPLTDVELVSVDGEKKLSYSEIYAANVESCVSINVSSTGINFFGQPVKYASSGSGFVITEDGYIVTNYHVISGGQEVQVTFQDGTSFPGQVVGGDKDYDIAVIKVEPKDKKLRPVVLGTTEDLHVGDEVVAIGNPLGELTFSMSEGIASCLDREINVDGTPFNMIQITAAVNSGNSGGPLFNIYGEVIGIVSAKYSTSGSGASVEGLGFAIPIDDVWHLIRDIMENGFTTRPYMGIKVDNAARYPQLGVKAGACIVEVAEDSPAEKAGLQVNDVITMVGKNLVTSSEDVVSYVGSKSYKSGDSVTITYVRNGEVATTELVLGSTPQVENTSYESAPQYEESYPYNDMQQFFDQFFGDMFG